MVLCLLRGGFFKIVTITLKYIPNFILAGTWTKDPTTLVLLDRVTTELILAHKISLLPRAVYKEHHHRETAQG